MSSAIAGLPVGEIATAHRFDIARLEAYLRKRLDDFGADLSIHQFQGGASNPTFLLVTHGSAGRRRFVMRKKPPGPLLPSAHQVDQIGRASCRERAGVWEAAEALERAQRD